MSGDLWSPDEHFERVTVSGAGPDFLGFAVAGFMILSMIVGTVSMVIWSIDLIHQLMRVCR